MTDLRKRMLEELQRRNYSPTTIRYYLRVVENFARYFGKRPDRLTQENIREYQVYLLQERKLQAGTVGLHIAALRFFFVKTLRRPYLQLDLPSPKRPKRLPTILSQDEVARLIESANNLLDYAMLMTLYATGVRRAELSRLKVEDIDSERMIVHIRQGKGNRDRDVPLTPKLLKTLREYWQWMKPKTYLFPGMVNNWRADKPLTPKCVWSAVQDAAKRAGITKARVAAHAAPQLGHSPTGKWHGSPHDPDVDGACRPARYKRLSAFVPPSPASGHQPRGGHVGFQTRHGETIQKKKAGSMNRPAVEVADILRAQGDTLH